MRWRSDGYSATDMPIPPWVREGFFSIDHPVDFAHWFEEVVEGIPANEARMFTEEVQFPRIMQLGQPFQNETSIQTGQNPDGQEEVLTAGDPLYAIRR